MTDKKQRQTKKALYDTVMPPGVADERIIGQEKKYIHHISAPKLNKNAREKMYSLRTLLQMAIELSCLSIQIPLSNLKIIYLRKVL